MIGDAAADVAIDAEGTDVAPRWLIVEETQYLQRYRRIGHDVFVRPAYDVSLVLEMCVRVAADYITEHVRAAILSRLATTSASSRSCRSNSAMWRRGSRRWGSRALIFNGLAARTALAFQPLTRFSA